MNRRLPYPPSSQRGWSLIESAVVLLLVGVMSTGLWKTMEMVSKNQRSDQSRDVLQRAQDALHGMALRDLHLPMPEDATASPTRPNHWEGWLPEQVLVTEPRRSIRYIVDRDLVTPPGTLRFQADPMGLIPNPPPPAPPYIASRDSANSLDFCLKVIQREASAVATVNGMNLALGVQMTDRLDTVGSAAPEFQWNATPPNAGVATSQLSSRTSGHIELVHLLGCIQGISRVTAEVKSAALFNDLYTIARINTDLKGLELQAARDFLRSHEWRRKVAMTNLTISIIRIVTNLIAMGTTPAGALLSIANVAPLSLAVTLWAGLVQLSNEGAAANAKAIPGLMNAQDLARNYANGLADQRDRHLLRANAFQFKGVQP